MNRIKPLILPMGISAIIVLLWIIPAVITKIQGEGPGIWGSLSIIAFLLMAFIPIIYGSATREKIGATIVGVFPSLWLLIIAIVGFGIIPAQREWVMEAIAHYGILAVAGGFEGFFASRNDKKSLVIAVIISAFWVTIFFSGIH